MTYQKGEMKKINDSMQFGLELDISMFAEKPELYEGDDGIYELAGVLIHRGNPYGGHYHGVYKRSDEGRRLGPEIRRGAS